MGVDIDLHDLETPAVPGGEVLEHGADHPTRAAPLCPEVDDHGHGSCGLVGKGAFVGVDDPGQSRLTARAARSPARDCAHSVAGSAGGTGDGVGHTAVPVLPTSSV